MPITPQGEEVPVDGSEGGEMEFRSNEPLPEFSGEKPSQFKQYRKRLALWRLFKKTPPAMQGQEY